MKSELLNLRSNRTHDVRHTVPRACAQYPYSTLAFVQPAEAPSSDIRAMTKYSSQPLFPLVIFSWLGMLWGLLTEVNFFFSLRFGSLGVVGGETTNNEEHHTCIIATGPWRIAGDNVLKYIIVGWQSCPFAFIQTRKKLHVDLHIHRHASLQSALIIIHHSPVTCRSLLPFLPWYCCPVFYMLLYRSRCFLSCLMLWLFICIVQRHRRWPTRFL